MRFRASSTWPILPHHVFRPHHISYPAIAAAALLRRPATLSCALHATPSSGNSGGGGAQGNYLLVPGATMATILMLGILHARRLYDDKKVEDMKEKGVEPEFSPGFILEDSTFSSHLMLLGVPDDNGSPSHVKAFSLQSKGLGTSFCTKTGDFYCVIYLKPGDYNRVHSPVDWLVLKRRHFSDILIFLCYTLWSNYFVYLIIVNMLSIR